MKRLLQFLIDNKEWLFSGLGIAVFAALFGVFQKSIIRVSQFKGIKIGEKIIENGDIRIIGPRASGKTTYLAALADWHYIDTVCIYYH